MKDKKEFPRGKENQEEKEACMYWYYQKIRNEVKKNDFERFRNTAKKYFIGKVATAFFLSPDATYRIILKLEKNPPKFFEEYTFVTVKQNDV